ncbi:MAG: hypothetical protein EA382_02325 [Spirochaetaceae bacterium]|nr:MAG: hypothetical protein EA382_02325 [Spirochaetaceae bacterium]
MIGSVRAVLLARVAVASGAVPLALIVVVGCALGLAGVRVHADLVAVVVGERGVLHDRAGLYYTITNEEPRALSAVRVSFDVYDADGRPIPPDGSSIVVDVRADIPSGEARGFCTSIDDVVPPATPAVVVTRFRVTRVSYPDGTNRRVAGDPHPPVSSR